MTTGLPPRFWASVVGWPPTSSSSPSGRRLPGSATPDGLSAAARSGYSLASASATSRGSWPAEARLWLAACSAIVDVVLMTCFLPGLMSHSGAGAGAGTQPYRHGIHAELAGRPTA